MDELIVFVTDNAESVMGAIWFLVFALMSCLVFAVIGKLVGRVRNRPTEGFWLGFLLGPIGIVCALLLPAAGVPCPECKGILGKGARRCMHCGFDLHAKPKQYATPLENCPACGKLVTTGICSTRCPACGTAF